MLPCSHQEAMAIGLEWNGTGIESTMGQSSITGSIAGLEAVDFIHQQGFGLCW